MKAAAVSLRLTVDCLLFLIVFTLGLVQHQLAAQVGDVTNAWTSETKSLAVQYDLRGSVALSAGNGVAHDTLTAWARVFQIQALMQDRHFGAAELLLRNALPNFKSRRAAGILGNEASRVAGAMARIDNNWSRRLAALSDSLPPVTSGDTALRSLYSSRLLISAGNPDSARFLIALAIREFSRAARHDTTRQAAHLAALSALDLASLVSKTSPAGADSAMALSSVCPGDRSEAVKRASRRGPGHSGRCICRDWKA